MASWGKAKLSSAALDRIQRVNETLPDETLPGILGKLLRDASTRQRTPRLKPYGLLMDFPKPPNSPSAVRVEENRQDVDVTKVATQIVETVCSGRSGINVIIDLVSKVADDRLNELVMTCWGLLVEDEHKKSFVIAMSATRISALCVGSKILLPLLSDSGTFQNAVQTFGTVLGWLEGHFSHSTLVPLLLDEHSVINRDPDSFKFLLNHLSEIQKTETIAVFCTTVHTLRECHLHSLSLILDTPPVDPSVVQPLKAALLPRMAEYSENRLVGKIISSLISLLSASTSHQTYAEVSNLAGHFKGPMRFRLKQALAKVAKQIQTS